MDDVYDYMDAGGAIPWMELEESSRVQKQRATHGCMDSGDRVMHGAITEDAQESL